MSLVPTLKALAAAGGTPEQLIAVVEAHEAARADALAQRREADANRQKAYRERKSNVTSRDRNVTERDSRDPSPHVREHDARVVTPSSSLRSEGKEPPPTPNGVGAPKGAETARGSRLPEGWEPGGEDWAKAMDLLGGDVPAVNELDRFRDYWRAVPGAKGRKTDWPATWRNWVRRASENSARKAHERPHPDAKYDRKQANLARAFASAERVAGQRWEP